MSEDKKYFSVLGIIAFLAFLTFLVVVIYQIRQQAGAMVTSEEIEKAREIVRRLEYGR